MGRSLVPIHSAFVLEVRNTSVLMKCCIPYNVLYNVENTDVRQTFFFLTNSFSFSILYYICYGFIRTIFEYAQSKQRNPLPERKNFKSASQNLGRHSLPHIQYLAHLSKEI